MGFREDYAPLKKRKKITKNIVSGINKVAVFGPTALFEPIAEVGGHHLDRLTDFFRKNKYFRNATDATSSYLSKNKITASAANKLDVTDGRKLTSKFLVTTGVGGAGAVSGKKADEDNKMMHARVGKSFKPQNLIEKHPLLTGALSVGIAPHLMSEYRQSKLDKEMNVHFMNQQY